MEINGTKKGEKEKRNNKKRTIGKCGSNRSRQWTKQRAQFRPTQNNGNHRSKILYRCVVCLLQ